jgi:SAM-dependent methyltransferase
VKARTRILAKDLLPPIVARRIRGLRSVRQRAVLDAAGPRTPLEGRIEADAEWYDKSFLAAGGEHYQRPYWELNWYAALSVVADRILQMDNPRVLDMGCGPAPLAEMLHNYGLKHYTGFDFSPARLDFARSRGLSGYEFIFADVYTTDLFDGVEYDVVVGTEFLEHLERDLFVLDRIRPGSRVLCNVPDYPSASHLRWFSSTDEVADRYASRLDNFRCAGIRNVSGSSEFLFDGYVRQRAT